MEIVERFYRTQDLTGVFGRMRECEGWKVTGKTIKLYHYLVSDNHYLLVVSKSNQVGDDNPLINQSKLKLLESMELGFYFWNFFEDDDRLKPLV